MTRRTTEIISKWQGRRQSSHDTVRILEAPAGSTEPPPVSMTDDQTVACFTTRTLCRHLGISLRSWTRAALGLTPAPDLVVGRSPRWSPCTVERWLRSKPRFPGRKGG
jgi:hypothetical protein